jgi:hypothetical protein
VSDTRIDSRYQNLTCYNCGEPSHFVGICDKPKVCFICGVLDCQNWKQTQLVESYIGGAGACMGFYHIDLLEIETTR